MRALRAERADALRAERADALRAERAGARHAERAGAPHGALHARWAGALHAEWTKLRTVPGTLWLLLGSTALTAGVSAAAVASVRCQAGAACPVDPAKLSLSGVQLGQAVVAILAVLAISGEYGTGMIRVTLTAVPGRTTVLAAKATVVTGLVLAAGTAGVLASVLAGRLILPGHGFSPARGYELVSLGQGPVLRAAAGSVLYLALIALLYLFPIIASVATDPHWERHLQQIGPMTAGLDIQATTGLSSLPLSPWAGLGVLAAWAGGAMLAGGLVLRLRDA